ncbi:hypothetical protein PV08_07173 [Exophiala spinifera]|uniref:Aminoglycoside phosphotransferase domain-containing protein n=1 Tax=Exophiala spinifera TaxID=91928 RepID=A0A0D1YHI8_9EURO|nr:uncharacterized protein PV08_07173 [Exophiala spinifera]KIW14391.1 hypothetical protein PV08_07173 [Exophiala spinifera]
MKAHWTRESVEAGFDQARADPSAILLDSFGRRVFRHNRRIIKYGEPVNCREAKALTFIAGSGLSIPVPEVYSCTDCEGITIIDMEMVTGDTSESVWPQLSQDEKHSYARQLRGIVNQLRSLEGDYIGSLDQGPGVDARRGTHQGGPFPDEASFNDFLLSNTISKTPRVYRKMLEGLLSTSHKTVFTHGDLSLTNVVIREGQIVGVLDWETAGWYPEYWEFVQFFRAVYSDYREYADIIFDKLYPEELMTDHFLSHLTRH